MRIALVTSPHVKHPEVLRRDFAPSPTMMYTFLPVGLLSIASSVQTAGHRPWLVDLNRAIQHKAVTLGTDFYAECAAFITKGDPEIVGFMTECDSFHHVLQICNLIKAHKPDTFVVLGGPQASVVAEETMAQWGCIDAIVVGEGETSFRHLLGKLEGAIEGSVPGTLVRRSRGFLVGGPIPLLDDLDELPIPAYELYTPDVGEELFLEVGRGCPFRCTFCSTAPFWKRRHRVKSPARILAEIDRLRALFRPERLHFTHDLFTTDRRWVEAVCEALTAAGRPVRWTCSARTDTVSPDLLSKMALAGCDAIYFGLESGSSTMLRRIRKAIPTSQSLRVLEECRAVGITPNAGFIIGFPEEDRGSAQDTFSVYEKALRLGCKPTHLFGFCPFVGASVFGELGELEFRNHFVDLPLTPELEAANRTRLSQNQRLFSSYFRTPITAETGLSEAFVDGIDEFSPLVEMALLPTLILADAINGLLNLYERWLSWIGARNEARRVSVGRKYYGRPSDYCEFLTEQLGSLGASVAAACELAKVLHRSTLLESRSTQVAATRMARYRSFDVDLLGDITLSTTVKADGILDGIVTHYDLSEALRWRAGDPIPDFPAQTTYLVWQRTSQGDIRILRLEPGLHNLLSQIGSRQAMIAEIIAASRNDDSEPIPISHFEQIADLVRQGLLAGVLTAEGPPNVASR